jgi:hypothetical protein
VQSRARRFAENEALFRELNDRIDETGRRFYLEGQLAQKFVCECGHAGCTDWVTLTMEEYHAIRGNDAWFFVTPGHDEPEVERVVDQTERFATVEKIGEAGAIAVERAHQHAHH